MSDMPVCYKCGQVMTPQNAQLRPELFYHDNCLPDEFRPPGQPTKRGTPTPEQRADEIEKAWVRFTPKWPGVKTLIVNAIREAETAVVVRERERCAVLMERCASAEAWTAVRCESDDQVRFLAMHDAYLDAATAIRKGETP